MPCAPAGDHFSVQSLLPANAPEGAIMGLVIPGYTQELLDERTVAIPHSGECVGFAC